MVLSRLTKITGPGIRTDTNWVGNNANYTGILTAASLGGIGNLNTTGIITATKFVGPIEGNVTAVDGTFSGNVSIAGTLTYEDVTNIDSVGIITGKGADINGDLDVDGHTNLDNVSIAGVTTISSSDLIVKPTTVSSSRIKLGYNEQMKISVSSANQNVIQSTAAYLQIASNNINLSRQDTNLHMARFLAGQQCKLTYNYIDRIATSGVGATVYGQFDTTNLNIAGVSTFTGNIDANGDLDVDGHTELDNVNIAGVSTFATDVSIADKIVHTGDENTSIRFPSADTIRLETGGTARLTVDANGNTLASGGLYAQANLIMEDRLVHNGDGDTMIRFPEADAVTIETNGSERFRINSSGAWGIGAAYGSSGQVLTSGGSGSSPSWTTITGTTINNNADNRIITGSGTANTLNAESNVLYDGTNFGIGKSPSRTLDVQGKIRSSDSVCFGDNSSTPSEGSAIHRPADSSLAFVTNNTERVRIVSTGGVGINTDKVRNTRNVSIAGVTRDYTNSGTDLVDAGGIILQPTIHLPSTGQAYPGIFWSGNVNALGRARAGIMGVAMSNNDATDIVFLSKLNAGGAAITPADESMRITYNGKVGINSTTPQQTLDVRGSINGGSENQPFQRFHDSHGDQRVTKHYFRCTRGGTSIFDILTVDLNTNFHQALIILYYGARIQNVADSVTYPVHKIIGVNRFNGGNVQFTKNTIVQDGNASSHADIDAVAMSSTQYRIRLTFSGTAGGSSFAAGHVEIIGLGPGTDGAFYSLAHAHGITR